MFYEKETLGSMTVTLVATVITTILRGWALSILWGWFAVPIGLPGLNLTQAIGIILILSILIVFPFVDRPDQKWLGLAYQGLTAIGAIGLLAFGWIVHLFM